MTKRKTRWSWPVRLGAVLVTIVLICMILSFPAVLMPYIASIHYIWVCHVVLAPIFFVLICGAIACAYYCARNTEKVKRLSYGGAMLRCIAGGAFLAVPWAWMFMIIVPAIPSKFFAHRAADFSVTVDHLEGFRLDTDYWTWIYFDQNSSTNRFMWTRSDPLLSTLKRGDCIMLHAREWPLGIYVDSISRSNACPSPSGTESE